jgi:general stress protein 26
MKNKINCLACKFYYVTWDRNHPHGCRAMGFKGKEIPSMTVLKTTGKKCRLYEKKKHAAKKIGTQ